MKRNLTNRKKGSVAALAFVGCIPLVAAIGGISVDSMHFNDARGALQRATDAAALTGMEYLGSYVGNKSWGPASTTSNANENNVNYGISVAAMNGVDGTGLYDNTAAKRTVSVELQSDSTLAGYTAGRPNKCVATGQVYIHSIFAQFFGNFGQTVNTRSVAGMMAETTVDAPAPLLVSWTDPDPNKQVMRDTAIGSDYTIIIKDMGDKESNAIWIANPTPVLEAYLDYLQGKGPRPSYSDVPAYTIGDVVQTSNGVKGGVSNLKGLEGHTLPILITDDNGTGLTAKGQPRHTVTRIIGMQIKKVDDTPGKDGFQITGKLIPITAVGSNTGGTNNVPSGAIPYMVRLIQ